MSAPRDSGFEALAPASAFAHFAREEIARIEQTEADFDATLYQEALELVLARLPGEAPPAVEVEAMP